MSVLSMLKRLIGLLALTLLPGSMACAADGHDVRVLIDISGSMRQNDPQNLRRPALRMLVGLLQPNTRAGVWTFANWSNPLVPMAEVDKAWKDRAIAASEQIQSPGLFTNIERVLSDATKDWEGQPESHRRNLILLTDGMVDVSKEPGASEASRQRILDLMLPKLKQMGIKVHTIALSERADHQLMKQLSTVTGGWYQQVDSADNLQRVFLKMFEQVGNPDTVPIKDNRFKVDSTVSEATVLLFREPGSPQPVLIAPDGKEYTTSDLIAGVAWHTDQGHELITIDSPMQGEWRVDADLDPDNRVMVVTALRLETSAVPAHIAAGEPVQLNAHLSNQGKMVRRQAFLRLLSIRADAINELGTRPLGLNDEGQPGDERAADGVYGMRFSEPQAIQQVELLFSVESPTFMREKRYFVAVHEPVETLWSEAEGSPVLQVSMHQVMRNDAELQVWQAKGVTDAQRESLMMDSTGQYRLLDPDLPVFIEVQGLSSLGNQVNRRLGPLYPPGRAPEEFTAPPAVNLEPSSEPPSESTLPEMSEVEAEEPKPTPSSEPAEEARDEADEEDGGLMPLGLFIGSNLLLIAAGGGAWWFIRRRKPRDAEESLLDEFEDTSA